MGCIRDLTFNKAFAGVPSYSQGIVPCYQIPLQLGMYFSAQGGHVAIGSYQHVSHIVCSSVGPDCMMTDSPVSLPAEEPLLLSWDLEVQLEVRPISDSGLLLHAGTSPERHLTLGFRQREVRASNT